VNAARRFWLITIAAGLAIALTIGLGRWQLSRAAEKEALAAAMASQSSQSPLSGLELAGRADRPQVMHRPVVLHGRWLPEHTVFLDNRQMNAKPGLFVVTPLALTDSSAVVLVQRGWVQRNFLDRFQLPPVDTPPGLIDIQGQIVPFPSRRIALGGKESGPIWQNPDILEYRSRFGDAFSGISVRLTSGTADGLLRDWPAPDDGVDKHLGYAFQWFTLSAVVAIYFLWFQIVKGFRHQPTE